VWGATTALAIALIFFYAVTQPGAADRSGLGTFMGFVATTIGVALHLAGAVRALLVSRPRWLRLLAAAGIITIIVFGAVWLLGRAPRLEVLFALLTAPPVAGIVGLGVTARRRDPWPAVAFLALTLLLVLVLGPRWVRRVNRGDSLASALELVTS
jgi:hypothetical protein